MNPARLVLKNQFGEESINVVLGTVVPLVPNSDILVLSGATAPVNGTTGANIAEKGSHYIAQDTGALYYNSNTKVSPTWTAIGAGTTATLLTGLSAAAGAIAATDSVIQAFDKLLSLQHGKFTFDSETISAAGALSTTVAESLVNNATGGDYAVTLAAPSNQDGQMKVIKLGTATHKATLAMTNIAMSGGYTPTGTTTLTFTSTGDCAVLMAVGAKWQYMGGSAVAS